MPRLMLDRQVVVPPSYAERGCLLVKYRLPWLRHCYVLCHEPVDDALAEPGELLAFFIVQAEQLAQASVGDPQAFMFIHSGASVRKRPNWHLHVFVIQHRWQKAWVYAVLAAKNVGMCIRSRFQRLMGRHAPNHDEEGRERVDLRARRGS